MNLNFFLETIAREICSWKIMTALYMIVNLDLGRLCKESIIAFIVSTLKWTLFRTKLLIYSTKCCPEARNCFWTTCPPILKLMIFLRICLSYLLCILFIIWNKPTEKNLMIPPPEKKIYVRLHHFITMYTGNKNSKG